MRVAWFDGRKEPSESPAKGTSDGPSAAYLHPRIRGRGDHGPVLPRGRRLRAAQPEMSQPRVAQEALGLRGPDVGALPATEGYRERTLLPAGCREVLRAPVPRSGGDAPFLVPSPGEEAQALFGAAAPRDPAQVGG